MIKNIFNEISPFGYLTEKQKNFLWTSSESCSYSRGDIISSPEDTSYDHMFLLLQGEVIVTGNNNTIGHIISPAYFGELSVLLREARKAKLIAQTDIICLKIEGENIRQLLHENHSFSAAFSSIIQNKLGLFKVYDSFIAQLVSRKDKGYTSIAEMVKHYNKLDPILHKRCNSDEIDFEALKYIFRRLPNDITSLSYLYLVEDMPFIQGDLRRIYHVDFEYIQKRLYLHILPGKLMINLRDELSDYIGIMTELCVYHIETTKIRNRLSGTNRKYNFIKKYFQLKNSNAQMDESIVEFLPLSKKEISQLKEVFGRSYIDALYEVLMQNGELSISFKKQTMRYYAIASERWINQIKNSFDIMLDSNHFKEDYDIHIISSNTHSINNILSGWLHQHEEQISSWAEINLPEIKEIKNKQDRLYIAARFWFEKHPEQKLLKEQYDMQNGLLYINDTALTGVDVSIIDLDMLDQVRDPYLCSLCKKTKKTIIINIDYGYGKQAEVIIHNLILLFSKHIRSISIMGKCGGITGNRGELIIPDLIVPQYKQNPQSLENNDISHDDLKSLGWKRPIHRGSMLTVLGTLMQNSEMLQYYRTFWNSVGMEMEGSFYLGEIRKAIVNGNISKDVKLRFIYYISDNPTQPLESLSKRMTYQEGVPAVYTISRAIINKIFADEGD